MSEREVIALLLMLAVPTWALFSRSPVRRARFAVIFWTFILGVGCGVGVFGAVAAFLFFALMLIAISTQRVPAEITIDIRTDLSVPPRAGTEGDLLVVGSYAQAPALVEFGVYRLPSGDYLRLEYVSAGGVTQVSVWAESFLRSGIWVRSSEALRWEGAPLPHERVHMRDNGASNAESLLRYHRDNLARYGTDRETLDAEEYVLRYAQRHADQLRHEEALGMMRRRGGFFRGTPRSWWRAIRLGFDLSPLWRPEQILIGSQRPD